MNKILDTTMAKRAGGAIAGAFLVIHIVMLNIFVHHEVTPMVYFNVFSIAFYVFAFALLHWGKLRLFSLLVYLEVVCHMTAAVYFTGWENGFQVTLIGMSALAFFAEYMGHSLQIRHLHALPLCMLGMVMYLGSFVVSSQHPAEYPLSAQLSFWLQIAWGVIVFVVSVAVLQAFVLFTFSSEEALERRLEHDRLTGLCNREHMARYLAGVAKEESLVGHWIAMADLDDFKHINDTYGHNCGDLVLKSLAAILQDVSGNVEVCRWGGEEFLLAGRATGDAKDLKARFERLRKAVESHTVWYGEQRIAMTITIGVALYEEGESVSEWINRADKLMYEGKTAGKNRVVM